MAASGTELVELVFEIARLGYWGPIPERCLSSLVAHAQDRGVQEVLSWIAEDPGYLVVASWQFPLPGFTAAMPASPKLQRGEPAN